MAASGSSAALFEYGAAIPAEILSFWLEVLPEVEKLYVSNHMAGDEIFNLGQDVFSGTCVANTEWLSASCKLDHQFVAVRATALSNGYMIYAIVSVAFHVDKVHWDVS